MVQLNSTPAAWKIRGFSLIELLAVTAILIILMALAVSTLRSQRGLEISVGVNTLVGALDEARIAAISRNKYVQVRLLREGTSGPFTSLVLFEADSPYYRTDQAGYTGLIDAGLMRQLGGARDFGSGLVVANDERSPLATRLASDPEFPRTGRMRIGGRDRDFLAFYFRPNGATDFETTGGISADPTRTYFAVGQAAEMEIAGSDLPDNFALVTLFPTTGRYLIYRP
jgi:uncharacterized protein (TIGR02596 family)